MFQYLQNRANDQWVLTLVTTKFGFTPMQLFTDVITYEYW